MDIRDFEMWWKEARLKMLEDRLNKVYESRLGVAKKESVEVYIAKLKFEINKIKEIIGD